MATPAERPDPSLGDILGDPSGITLLRTVIKHRGRIPYIARGAAIASARWIGERARDAAEAVRARREA